MPRQYRILLVLAVLQYKCWHSHAFSSVGIPTTTKSLLSSPSTIYRRRPPFNSAVLFASEVAINGEVLNGASQENDSDEHLASSVSSVTNGEQQQQPSPPPELSLEDQDYYINAIKPKTKPLLKSAAFYAAFVVRRLAESRRKALEKRRIPKTLRRATEKANNTITSIWQGLKLLNQQRRNASKLAGYDAPIIIPSFTFLILGALMQSVVPKYYGDCITYVVSSEATKSKVFRAIGGLMVTSLLASALTGMRGSLFWIAGTCLAQ